MLRATRQQVADLLAVARTCQAADKRNYLPFFVETRTASAVHVGWVRPAFAAVLQDEPSSFQLQDGKFTLRCASDTMHGCTDEMRLHTHKLREAGVITGWRDELYGVGAAASPLDNNILVMERAAATYFGTLQFGIHVNVYVPQENNQDVPEFMWIARRSETKQTW